MGNTKNGAIRVLVVNDHQIERRGITTMLKGFKDLLVVGVARTGIQAVQLCETTRPDVVLMDLLMPDMDGAEATRMIHDHHPNIHVIVTTSWDEYNLVQRALTLGAESYLLKNASAIQIAETVRAAQVGHTEISLPLPDLGADLTTREVEVLIQVAQGLTNAQVAIHLNISRATVKYYVSSILGKMGAESRTEAVGLAVQHGLVNLPERQ